MDSTYSSSADELLRNAELRTELEPYADESLTRVNSRSWTLQQENQYLASMLEWEKARIKEGYHVTIEYDPKTGIYTGTAIK